MKCSSALRDSVRDEYIVSMPFSYGVFRSSPTDARLRMIWLAASSKLTYRPRSPIAVPAVRKAPASVVLAVPGAPEMRMPEPL